MEKKAAIGAMHSNRPWRKTFSKNTFCMIAMGLLLPAAIVDAQQPAAASSAESNSAAINAANNPTTPKLTFEAQDYWMPSVYGLGGRDGSLGLQRNLIPIKTFGVQNIFHVILPVVTNPSPPKARRPDSQACNSITYRLCTYAERHTVWGLSLYCPQKATRAPGRKSGRLASPALSSLPHIGGLQVHSSPISMPLAKDLVLIRSKRHSSRFYITTFTAAFIQGVPLSGHSIPARRSMTFPSAWAQAKYGRSFLMERQSTYTSSRNTLCGTPEWGRQGGSSSQA
jgi:hypothetical protein